MAASSITDKDILVCKVFFFFFKFIWFAFVKIVLCL